MGRARGGPSLSVWLRDGAAGAVDFLNYYRFNCCAFERG